MALLAQARDEKRSKEGRLAAIQSLALLGDPEALPFLVTIFGMAIFATRVRPPAALARPFIRGLK